MAISKNIIKDELYQVILTKDQIMLFKGDQTKKCKYQVSIRLNSKVGWILNSKKQLIAFIIQPNHKAKSFHASENNLITFKQLLQNEVSFYPYYAFYENKKLIGQGAQAKVMLAQSKQFGYHCAIKVIDKKLMKPLGAFEVEVQIMKSLKQKQFVQIIEIFQSESHFYVVLQLMEGQSLTQLMNQYKGHLPQTIVNKVMKNLLEAVKLLHQNGIMHRDLKPDNIMFAKQNDYSSLTLIDFGLATFTQLNVHLLYKCGTPGYVAPEIVESSNKIAYTNACDLFSCGCIFYQLLTGQLLFKNQQVSTKDFNSQLMMDSFKQLKRQIEPIEGQNYTQAAIELLKGLLIKNPKHRLTAQQSLYSAYFSDNHCNVNDEKHETECTTISIPIIITKQSMKQCLHINIGSDLNNDEMMQDKDIKWKQFLSPQTSPIHKNMNQQQHNQF